MTDQASKFSLLDCDQALSLMAINKQSGHTSLSASKSLAQVGPNRLTESNKDSYLKLFFDQFRDLTVIVLIIAAIISLFAGEASDTWAIVIIVVLNAFLGFIQEARAEKAMEALRNLTQTTAKVLRDHTWQSVSAEDLVPGDIITIEAGDKVPADARVLDAYSLEVDESAMTGESQPVTKTTAPLDKSTSVITEQRNLVFKGTVITRGRGVALIFSTGMNTEIGKIARLLDQNPRRMTPLQVRLANFGKRLALIVIALCALIYFMGIFRGEPPLKLFMTSLSLAVAAIPEALPAVVTILLSLGARSMSRQNALIRKLPAVETLGSVTYICTDKTGTLTQNRMQVESIGISNEMIPLTNFKIHTSQEKLLAYGFMLNNDAYSGVNNTLIGDPTETSMIEAGARFGLTKESLAREMPRLDEIPFSSERMMMSTLHQYQNSTIMLVKGAPEKIIPLCRSEFRGEQTSPIDVEQTLSFAARMACEGLRVIAFATRSDFPSHKQSLTPDDENDLTFLGFLGLIDPPRPEAYQAVHDCQNASINVVMITGDHPTTAVAIAKKLGILHQIRRSGDDESIITGRELSDLNEHQLTERVKNIRVYARTSPEQKIKIVSALQSNGEIVAMTGDGVNDAPALKRADIGVAMGKGGTDVAREASHMVLLDDNFATIVVAIKEGRRIFDNIRKFTRYVLTGNSGEIWALLLAPFMGMPLPLLPIQILFVNLLTDGLPGIALASEPADKQILRRSPRPPKESIFANGLWEHAIWIGLFLGAATLFAFYIGSHESVQHGQTMAFTVLTLGQLFHVLAIRSESESIFSLGFSSNKQLLIVVLATAAIQVIAIYNPLMNSFFKTHPISSLEFLMCVGIAAAVGTAAEIDKLIRRTQNNNRLSLE